MDWGYFETWLIMWYGRLKKQIVGANKRQKKKE
jgi:hypothetical protein